MTREGLDEQVQALRHPDRRAGAIAVDPGPDDRPVAPVGVAEAFVEPPGPGVVHARPGRGASGRAGVRCPRPPGPGRCRCRAAGAARGPRDGRAGARLGGGGGPRARRPGRGPGIRCRPAGRRARRPAAPRVRPAAGQPVGEECRCPRTATSAARSAGAARRTSTVPRGPLSSDTSKLRRIRPR